MSDEEFESEWDAITAGLELNPATELPDVTPPEPTPPRATNASTAPRDWVPEPEDDTFDPDLLDPSLTSPTTPPSSPYAVLLWLVPVVMVVLALFVNAGLLPGGKWMVAVLSIAAIGGAAIAVFASSPHEDDEDPYDDGARL